MRLRFTVHSDEVRAVSDEGSVPVLSSGSPREIVLYGMCDRIAASQTRNLDFMYAENANINILGRTLS